MLSYNTRCAHVEVFIAALAPPLQQHTKPPAILIPDIGPLTACLYTSSNKLFFISHQTPGSSVVEWTLVQANLAASLQVHPTTLQDGCVLADFYICHPSDKQYSVTNQRYWLHYHPVLSDEQYHTAYII